MTKEFPMCIFHRVANTSVPCVISRTPGRRKRTINASAGVTISFDGFMPSGPRGIFIFTPDPTVTSIEPNEVFFRYVFTLTTLQSCFCLMLHDVQSVLCYSRGMSLREQSVCLVKVPNSKIFFSLINLCTCLKCTAPF